MAMLVYSGNQGFFLQVDAGDGSQAIDKGCMLDLLYELDIPSGYLT